MSPESTGLTLHELQVHQIELEMQNEELSDKLASARRFDQVVVAISEEMALMRTVHPLDFARIKLALSQQAGRDANRRGKDALQATIVNTLVMNYLP